MEGIAGNHNMNQLYNCIDDWLMKIKENIPGQAPKVSRKVALITLLGWFTFIDEYEYYEQYCFLKQHDESRQSGRYVWILRRQVYKDPAVSWYEDRL